MKTKNSFKRKYPADAANIFVRNLLCDISEELGGFTEKDWRKTLKYFDNKCAYTGLKLPKNKIVKDHLIAHNRQSCGLHLFGNVIPSSKEANAAKSGKDFESFIATDNTILGNLDKNHREERILRIKEFQEMSGYFEKLKQIESSLNLHDFVMFQYDFILRKVEENRQEFNGYVDGSFSNINTIAKTINGKDLNSKVERWSTKPYLNVHKIIAVILQNEGVKRGELMSKIEQMGISKNILGTIVSLMSDGGNNYGRIIQDIGGTIHFYPEVKDKIILYKWII